MIASTYVAMVTRGRASRGCDGRCERLSEVLGGQRRTPRDPLEKHLGTSASPQLEEK